MTAFPESFIWAAPSLALRMKRERLGKHFSIIVVAEGAFPIGVEPIHVEAQPAGRAPRLGGIGESVATAVAELTGKETRVVVLGHFQRGGAPATFDRVLDSRCGAAAARLVRKGEFGRMVALLPPYIQSVPIPDAIRQTKTVPLDHDVIQSAREIGISFGDQH